MPEQKISEDLVVILQNKINGRTSNVNVYGEILTHTNGGQYIRLHIARGSSAASTTSGKFFIRVSDNSVPVIGSDINRISAEKGYYRWEDEPSKWSWKDADPVKLDKVITLLRESERVSKFVKQKDTKELLDYFFLTEEESDKMTYLGVLFLGTQSQRGRVVNSPVLQCIKYDEYGDKVKKYLWDDFTKNPYEIIEEVWENIPDWKETNLQKKYGHNFTILWKKNM